MPQPHEGLLAFNNAFFTLNNLANFKDSSAPFLYSLVTSFCSLFTTLSEMISDGGLGVLRPPNISGHIGITSLSFM